MVPCKSGGDQQMQMQLVIFYCLFCRPKERSTVSVQLTHIWYQWGKLLQFENCDFDCDLTFNWESETLENLLGYLTVQEARFLAMGIFQILLTELIFVSQHRAV